jgi:hypothetical protein
MAGEAEADFTGAAEANGAARVRKPAKNTLKLKKLKTLISQTS